MANRTLVAALVAAALITGCSSDDETADGSGAAPTESAPDTTAPTGTDGTTGGSTPAADCENSLEVVNAAADDGITNGEVDVVTAWTDGGPHPDNTVDYDRQLDLMLADYEVPEDPQFGYSIPVGVPDVPDGNLHLSFSLAVDDGEISAGDTFVGSTSEDEATGSITNYGVWAGTERVLVGDPLVTITMIDDERVCGTISSTTATDLQQFAGVEGSFRADRIQALEATDE